MISDCMLSMNDDLTSNHPLILSSNNPKWVSLDNSPKGYVTIGRHDSVRLACASRDPSKKNGFAHFDTDIISAKCKSGKDFEVNKKSYSFKDLHCEFPVEATNVKTGEQCLGKDTELIKIGFKAGNEFILEYLVCFDKKEKLTKYTEVTVPASIEKAVTGSKEQKWMNADDFHKDINLDSIYKCETQKDTFKRILNKNYFENNRCCLERGKLVSNNDMMFLPEQASTANYLNTVPQWSTCNMVNNN